MGWEGNDREGPGTGKATTQATGNPLPAADRILPILQLNPKLNGGNVRELTINEEG